MKILLDPELHRRLDDAAHAARLPASVFARQLLDGLVPKVSPPIDGDLSQAAKKLLSICTGLASNLTQLNAHALAAGEPLSRLSGPDGLLLRLKARDMEIGLQIKSGHLVDEKKIGELIDALEGPAQALNEKLARPLNEGRSPSLNVWGTVVQSLQVALLSDGMEPTNG